MTVRVVTQDLEKRRTARRIIALITFGDRFEHPTLDQVRSKHRGAPTQRKRLLRVAVLKQDARVVDQHLRLVRQTGRCFGQVPLRPPNARLGGEFLSAFCVFQISQRREVIGHAVGFFTRHLQGITEHQQTQTHLLALTKRPAQHLHRSDVDLVFFQGLHRQGGSLFIATQLQQHATISIAKIKDAGVRIHRLLQERLCALFVAVIVLRPRQRLGGAVKQHPKAVMHLLQPRQSALFVTAPQTTQRSIVGRKVEIRRRRSDRIKLGLSCLRVVKRLLERRLKPRLKRLVSEQRFDQTPRIHRPGVRSHCARINGGVNDHHNARISRRRIR